MSALSFTIGLAALLITLRSNTAYADYQRTITFDFASGSNTTDIIDISGAISITPLQYSYSSANPPNTFKYSFQSGTYPSYSNDFAMNTPIQVDSNSIIRFRFSRVVNGSVQALTMDDFTYMLTFPGSDPDQGQTATEQRYNNQTFYSADFTKSNSLPLIYTGSLFLSDFTPNGNCNSIQVDASTVGGDQLEWRLNLGQSGIDGQSAWLPIGFKLPIQIGAFDEHSIQLRMKDPDNPGQYYDLQPSELSMCTVSYGYSVDIYLGIPPGEYQELPTQEMPTINNYELPTMPDISGYVTTPVSIVSMIFTWLTSLPHIAILIGVLAFAYVIKVIIW